MCVKHFPIDHTPGVVFVQNKNMRSDTAEKGKKSYTHYTKEKVHI